MQVTGEKGTPTLAPPRRKERVPVAIMPANRGFFDVLGSSVSKRSGNRPAPDLSGEGSGAGGWVAPSPPARGLALHGLPPLVSCRYDEQRASRVS